MTGRNPGRSAGMGRYRPKNAADLRTARRFDPVARGTRFRLFPQPPFLTGVREPEIVQVSSPAGSVGPGPSDHRMYVIDPLSGKPPYGINYGPYGSPYALFPPWNGAVAAPVMPDGAGHFDYLKPGRPEFEAAHVFGCIRFVLDVWEGYFGRRIPWHFEQDLERLEIVLLPNYDNAHAGYGFLELGSYFISGNPLPFTLNFDIIAHELGHLIILSEVGVPNLETIHGEYFGFHEALADLVACIACAHFHSVVDHLLEQTAGNLYVLNRLNRIGELSDNQQIRIASNGVPLSAFADGWSDEHDLSLPLSGAVFDILVDIFHELLVERRLITSEMEHLADVVERRPEYERLIQALFDQTFSANPDGFRQALLDARDTTGVCLAAALTRLSPHHLNYHDVAAVLLEVDQDLNHGRYQRLIRRDFELRGIGRVAVGPRLTRPDASSHAFSSRTLLPEAGRHLPPMAYRERWEVARRATRP
jgi:hypothetical protein